MWLGRAVEGVIDGNVCLGVTLNFIYVVQHRVYCGLSLNPPLITFTYEARRKILRLLLIYAVYWFHTITRFPAMVTVQNSTTRTPYNRAFPGAMSGLDNLRLEAQQCGFEHLWNDFESKIQDLFVDDATESRVGKVIDGRDHIKWATTRDKLLETLGKGISETL